MKQIILLLVLSFCLMEANALPLPSGATAPNWTMTDLNGVTHTLYDYLDQGKTVVIDFSATWCGPCWAYHNTHILKDLYNQKGPPGTNQVMVFFIEGDPDTPVSALYGGAGSQGNWVEGTPYPIIDDGTGQTSNAYQITYFPTLYAICPDRKIYEPGQVSLQTWINWIGSCSMNISATVDNADCYGLPGGSIDLTVNGGYGNKTYQWSNGANTQDISNLLAGNYAVTVTDGNSRTLNLQNLLVTSPPLIVPQTVSVTHVSCAGAHNGSATVSATGGVPGFTYTWDTGASGPTANNLAGGMHNVTIKDANNCTKVHSVMINEPLVLNGIPAPVGANCGNNDGLVTIAPSGGTVPYTFNIGNGPQAAGVFLGLYAGNYTVTITDAHNCTKLVPFTIPDLPGPEAAIEPPAAITCANAEVTLDGTGSGSGANVVYSWTTANGHIVSGANTTTPVVDMPGTYTLTVTNSQTECANTASVDVVENIVLPTADAGPNAGLDCALPEATLDGTGSSQGPEFAYLWTTDNGNIVSGQTTLTPLVDAAGTYTLSVTNTLNECVASASVDITASLNAPVASAGQDETIDCNVLEVVLDGSGSSFGPEFVYLWVGPGIVSGGNTLTPVVNQAATYTLEVTNTTNGCVETDEVLVTEDLATPVAEAGPDGLLNCNVSSLVLDGSASSSGPEFTFSWTTLNGNIASGGNTLTPTVDAPGNYVLEVVNTVNGCISASEAIVTENLPVEAEPGSITHVACFGEETGAATVSVSLGATPYTIAWSNGGSGETQENLPAGAYSVTVTDADNCEALVSFDIEEPAILTVNATANGESGLGNNDGTAAASPAGGVEPYDYLWSNGGTTATITGLAPGNYTVTVTDGNGCSEQETVTVNSFTCTINATIDGADITCNGAGDGAASVNINNGLEPFTILWSNGVEGAEIAGLEAGTYTVSITDENNCPATANITILEPPVLALSVLEENNAPCFGEPGGSATVTAAGGTGGYAYLWPSGNSEATEYDLAAGTYVVTLTDGNSCETTATVEIGEPQELTGIVNANPESSFQGENGSLSAVPAGGSPAYQYLWSTGLTTASIEGLAPGEYFVTVTDDHECSVVLSGIVEEYVCPTVEVSASVDSPSCNGLSDGEATLNVSGGTEPYSFSWPGGQAGPSASGLVAGVFEVAIQDGANCPYTVEVVVTEPEALTLGVEQQFNIECAGQTDGSATVAADGGTAGYEYAWSNGSTGATADNLAPGFHQVTATDANGCEATLEIEILVQDDITLPVIVIQDIILALDENGEASLTPAMIDAGSYDNCGIESTEISLSSFDCSQLGENEVTLTIKDINGNENSGVAVVTVVDETAPAIACPENVLVYNCDGFVEYEQPVASDNCGQPSVELTAGLGSGASFPLGTTTETWTASDASGNKTECSFTVTVENTVVETWLSATGTCPGMSQGTASIQVGGGTPPYAFEWSNGGDTETVTGLSAGTYGVTVTDATGCELTASLDVEEYAGVAFVVDEVINEQNSGQNGAIQVSPAFGTPPYTYEWQDELGDVVSNAEDLTGISGGAYKLFVTDANGCIFVTDWITVENITGTDEQSLTAGIWVYPNPASDRVNIRIKLNETAAVQLEVLDMKGISMAKVETDPLALHQREIITEQWAPGVYFLRVVVGEEVIMRRVVIE